MRDTHDIYAPRNAFVGKVCWGIGGIIVGLVISTYSAPVAFKTGYQHAFEKYGQLYPKQVKYFEQHRDQSCMLYWFGDSQSRVNEARKWMCQYTNRDGSLK
jgi:hypothetical protein